MQDYILDQAQPLIEQKDQLQSAEMHIEERKSLEKDIS